MSGRRWMDAEVAALRRLVPEIGYQGAALKLGRSLGSVYQKCHKLGIECPCLYHPTRRPPPKLLRLIREKHAAGWSDPEIAEVAGFDRHVISTIRRRLRLPSNAYNARHRAKSARTQFKPNQIRGNAARRWRAVGSIVIRNKALGPTRFIKVRDGGNGNARYTTYARWLWQRTHGPIPPGMLVVHADGNSMNDAIENLRLVDRRGHLELLVARDPGMEIRRRQRAGESSRRRHEVNRRRKAVDAEIRTRKGRRGKMETCPRKEHAHASVGMAPTGMAPRRHCSESSGTGEDIPARRDGTQDGEPRREAV